MNRCVKPEWLDELPAGDPGAIRSRSDLRRLNRCMGNARIMAQAFRLFPNRSSPVGLVELGAGDGDFLLRVARRLGRPWQGTRATLVDRRCLITHDADRGFRELGWEVANATADVFNWCRGARGQSCEVFVANLFLHHFDSDLLKELLREIAQRSIFFVAVEPRRSRLSLVFSELVGLVGCNAVTRHDATVSVWAGFAGDELSRLWPGNEKWMIREQPAGPFSHLFIALKGN